MAETIGDKIPACSMPGTYSDERNKEVDINVTFFGATQTEIQIIPEERRH